jgi:hypothetical protein
MEPTSHRVNTRSIGGDAAAVLATTTAAESSAKERPRGA